MRDSKAAGLICVVVLLAMTTGGCRQKSSVMTNLSTTVGGRQVTATLDGPAFLDSQSDGDIARLTFDNHRLVLEKSRVTLDGDPIATLNPASQRVDLRVWAGRLKVLDEGATVADVALGG